MGDFDYYAYNLGEDTIIFILQKGSKYFQVHMSPTEAGDPILGGSIVSSEHVRLLREQAASYTNLFPALFRKLVILYFSKQASLFDLSLSEDSFYKIIQDVC